MISIALDYKILHKRGRRHLLVQVSLWKWSCWCKPFFAIFPRRGKSDNIQGHTYAIDSSCWRGRNFVGDQSLGAWRFFILEFLHNWNYKTGDITKILLQRSTVSFVNVVYPKFRVTSEIMPRAVGALMFYMRSLLKISDVVFANKTVKNMKMRQR
jgi:hypothetical protein